MRSKLALLPALALALASAGCDGGEEQALASDGCDLLERALEAEPEELFAGDLAEDLEEFGARAEESDVSEAELEAAMQDECPEVIERLEAPTDPEDLEDLDDLEDQDDLEDPDDE